MKTKHTTGKWDDCINEFGNEIHIVSDSYIGKVVYEKGKNTVTKKEAQANAKLIAAAPEMLELLQAILQDDGFSTELGEGLNERIKTLITKL